MVLGLVAQLWAIELFGSGDDLVVVGAGVSTDA
jgi:hypothetical protein